MQGFSVRAYRKSQVKSYAGIFCAGVQKKSGEKLCRDFLCGRTEKVRRKVMQGFSVRAYRKSQVKSCAGIFCVGTDRYRCHGWYVRGAWILCRAQC